MRFHSISVVCNEADIIEPFVRHHARYVDAMHIVLHNCTDSTSSILEGLRAEGLPLFLSEDYSPHYSQAELCTRLLQECAREADVILFLDADEFLGSEDGNVAQQLQHISMEQPTLVPWRTYVPTPQDVTKEPSVLCRITHRRAEEAPQHYKVIVPSSIVTPDSHVALGAHALLNATGVTTPSSTPSSLFLAHFPIRCEARLRNKILNGWAAQLLRTNRLPGEGRQWETLYARCNDPRPICQAELQDIAMRYAASEAAFHASFVHAPFLSSTLKLHDIPSATILG